VSVPVEKVIAIYARENGQGMAFDLPGSAAAPAGVPTAPARGDTAPAPMALVPVEKITPPSAPDDDNEPPTPPRPGDRPKLTRVK
jgi:stringent starvation protein B